MFMFNYIHLWGPVCFFNWCIHVMIKCVHPCHLKYCALWFSFKFINPVCFFFFIFHMLFLCYIQEVTAKSSIVKLLPPVSLLKVSAPMCACLQPIFCVEFCIWCSVPSQLYFFPSVYPVFSKWKGLFFLVCLCLFLPKTIRSHTVELTLVFFIWLHWFIHLPLCWHQKSGNVRHPNFAF